ncbi:hypothetical protein BC629DRAFT_1526107 [Irpex lacteus]|nr:hypothetical protein BC629DRAFT_1526107 [Irpex lacteus]
MCSYRTWFRFRNYHAPPSSRLTVHGVSRMHLIVPVLLFSLRFISIHGFWINGRGTISELYAPKEGGGSAVYVKKGGDFCERL